MNTRLLWIPAALVAAMVTVAAPDAQASPFGTLERAVVQHGRLGPRIFVGGRVGVPLGGPRRAGHYREVVEYTGGYYVTRTREVELPGEQIGWDFAHRPIYGPARVEVQTYREWVPRQRIVRRVWVPHRARIRGHVSIGGLIRLR